MLKLVLALLTATALVAGCTDQYSPESTVPREGGAETPFAPEVGPASPDDERPDDPAQNATAPGAPTT